MKVRIGSLLGGAALAVVSAPLMLLAPSSAGASGSATLQKLPCTTMRTDPALEAPLYAQNEGANGSSDGWWCQLPHLTEVPSGFRQIVRTVAPLPNLYSNYETQYGPPTGGAAHVLGSGPGILLTDDVNGAVMVPSHLTYPSLPKGSSVSLGHGVTAVVSRQGTTTRVTWRYPSRGIPKYLHTVVQVTVSGTGVPASEVVAVARQVRPD
jgi:hypothetical protein